MENFQFHSLWCMTSSLKNGVFVICWQMYLLQVRYIFASCSTLRQPLPLGFHLDSWKIFEHICLPPISNSEQGGSFDKRKKSCVVSFNVLEKMYFLRPNHINHFEWLKGLLNIWTFCAKNICTFCPK